MSIEPTCEFCGVSVKPRCQTLAFASVCTMFSAERQTAYLDRVTGKDAVAADPVPDAGKMVKATNPKDRIASNRLPLDLVPDSLAVFAALSFAEGAAKYGAYNWRVAGVRASVYRGALDRHLKSWWNGEDKDPKTGVPHLASVIAGAAILLDADLAGKLTDDRPPKVALGALMRELEGEVARIRKLFEDHDPTHWTAENAPDANGREDGR